MCLPALPLVTLHIILDVTVYGVLARFAKRMSCEATRAQAGRRSLARVEADCPENLATSVKDILGAIVVIDVMAVEAEAVLIGHNGKVEDCSTLGL